MTATPPELRKYEAFDGRTFLIGVGATKCATSWIYTYLRSLEGVSASPLKEVHFFDRTSAAASEQIDLFAMKRLAYHFRQEGDVVENLRNRPAFQASLERVKMIYDSAAYLDHFAGICTADTKTLFEITPAYSSIGHAGFRYMKDFFATQDMVPKILFIMRDPVDRLWSHLRYRDQNTPDLNVLDAWPQMVEDPEIAGLADYRCTVDALDRVFPAENILFLFYEDLFCEATLRQLCTFAGAAYQPASTNESVNETTLKLDLPDQVRDALLDLLAPQYAFCRQRFSEDVPQSWRR